MAEASTPPLRPARPRRRSGDVADPVLPPAPTPDPLLEDLARQVGELHDVVWAIVDNLADLKAMVESLQRDGGRSSDELRTALLARMDALAAQLPEPAPPAPATEGEAAPKPKRTRKAAAPAADVIAASADDEGERPPPKPRRRTSG